MIEQIITTIPTPPTTSSPNDFDAKADAFLSALPTLGVELNNLSTEINSTAGDINTYKEVVLSARDEVISSENIAVGARDEAISARDEAQAARDIAIIKVDSITSMLPEGSIANEIVSNTSTWSSEKIEDILFDLKLGLPI